MEPRHCRHCLRGLCCVRLRLCYSGPVLVLDPPAKPDSRHPLVFPGVQEVLACPPEPVPHVQPGERELATRELKCPAGLPRQDVGLGLADEGPCAITI